MAVSVLTLNTSLVRGTTAKFNGNLTAMDGQAAIDCYFQYKITGAADWSDTSANKEELTAVGEFSYEIAGLTENESYDVRALAEWTDGTLQNAYGTIRTFNAYWVREGSSEDFERGILSGFQTVTHGVLAVFKTTGSHSWTVPAGVNAVDVLVVAGGGGGGDRVGGAGGAGGLIWETGFSVTPTDVLTVTVGDGGAGQVGSGQGATGADSIFSTLTAKGGGGGGGYGSAGLDGGSGGGDSGYSSGGAGSAIDTDPPNLVYQGHDGGAYGGTYAGAGGGGAGAVGQNGGGTGSPGDGGAGLDFSVEFGTSVGDSGWFAGGGGGSDYNYVASTAPAAGGQGGGGQGGVRDQSPGSGMANTGGGGGARERFGDAGDGGSGIVIIAVPLGNKGISGEGTRQKPYKISDKPTSEITWTATTPTDTTLAIEAQVKGTTAITDEAVGTYSWENILSFTGSDSWIDLGNALYLTDNHSFTAEGCIIFDSFSSRDMLLSRNDAVKSDSPYTWLLGTKDGTKMSAFDGAAWREINYSFVRNTVYHLAFSYDGTDMVFLVNGQIIGTYVGFTFSDSTTGRCTQIGGYYGALGDVHGKKWNVRFWDYARTQQQIDDNKHIYIKEPQVGLLLNVPMVEGVGSIVYDKSGNGYNGTIIGASWEVNNYSLNYWPANTPVIKLNGVETTDFALNNDRRKIIFDLLPNPDEPAITASYTAVDDPQEDKVEIQTLDLDGPTGGTFKLGDGTDWTADIAHDASAATIETALEGLYGAGNVEVERDIEILETYTTVGTTSWTVPAGVNAVDVFLVAGGGGGGGSYSTTGSGGGGAGGLIFKENHTVAPGTNISITVGGGGDGGHSGSHMGADGQDSIFDGLTAIGGGGGSGDGREAGLVGRDGGSGGGGTGGASSDSGTAGGTGLQPGSTDGGYGNDGGSGYWKPFGYIDGGGGGGAGEPGANSSTTANSVPGAGGDGLDYSAEFGADVGDDGWFAGGGGGGGYSASGSSGGQGGGGDSAKGSTAAIAGTANTGGGGGGSSSSVNSGANGGSGIVIITLPNFVITFDFSVGNSGLTADFTGLT